MKQEVWWVQSLMTVRSHLDCLAFELPKLRFKDITYLMKILLTCIIDKAGDVVGATSGGVIHHILFC